MQPEEVHWRTLRSYTYWPAVFPENATLLEVHWGKLMGVGADPELSRCSVSLNSGVP